MEMLRNIRFLYCGGSFTDPKVKKYFIDNNVQLAVTVYAAQISGMVKPLAVKITVVVVSGNITPPCVFIPIFRRRTRENILKM